MAENRTNMRPPKGARVPTKVNGKTVKRLLSYLKPYTPHLIVVVVCILITAAASVSSSLFLQTLIDDHILPLVGTANPDYSGLLGAILKIAVLFVDIRGFTALSEQLLPEQVVDILNGYLALTTESVFRHGGTLDKFVGDATMAVFNAPFDTEDYVYKAVLTAWDIVRGGGRIEKEYFMRYGQHVGFGVGINCGPAVVGNIGCDFRMDYTAIGDTVNTAARLEANAPRDTVYISERVYEQVKDRITAEEVGAIPLKGKAEGVFVYAVTGVNGYKSPEEE